MCRDEAELEAGAASSVLTARTAKLFEETRASRFKFASRICDRKARPSTTCEYAATKKLTFSLFFLFFLWLHSVEAILAALSESTRAYLGESREPGQVELNK